MEHRKKSIGYNLPLHDMGGGKKSIKQWRCFVIFFWILKQLSVLHYQRLVIMAKHMSKNGKKVYLYFLSLENESKVKVSEGRNRQQENS